MVEELRHFLEKEKCDFQLIRHEKPVLSLQDAAVYFDVSKAAPVLIVETEAGMMALIVSATRGRADFKALKREAGYACLRMVEREKVEEATGYATGRVPLIGHGLPCIFDNRLLQNDYIYGGSGDECCTLQIAPGDVKRLNKVVRTIG